MRPTVYDDGKSCPDQCKKPHVVFDSRHNGTPHAYDPKTSDPESKSFKPCKKKNDCRICFKAGNHCMNIQYQGGGPAYGRFDFPVIFYKKHCKDKNLPPQIKKKCSGILKNLEKIQADTKRINCFKDTKNKLCKEIMTIANKMKKQDKDIYKACRRDPKKYNSTSGLKPNEKRKYACHYSDMTVYFKSKHKGQACHRHWKLLMPSACGENKYVDRFGLNCCDTRLFWQAALGRSSNCKHFFPFDISKEPAIPIPEEKPKPEDNSIEI